MSKVIHDFSEAQPVLFSSIASGGFFKDDAGVIAMKMTPVVVGDSNAVNISTGVQYTYIATELVMAVDSEMTFRGSFGEGFS